MYIQYCNTKGKNLFGGHQAGVFCRLLLPWHQHWLCPSASLVQQSRQLYSYATWLQLSLVPGLFAMHWPMSINFGLRGFRVYRGSPVSMTTKNHSLGCQEHKAQADALTELLMKQ